MKATNFLKNILLSMTLLTTFSCVVDEQGKEVLDEEVISAALQEDSDAKDTLKSLYKGAKVYQTECQRKRRSTIAFLKNGDIIGVQEFYGVVGDVNCEQAPTLRDEYYYKSMKKGLTYTAVIYEAYKHPMYMDGDQYRERTFTWSCDDKPTNYCEEDAVVKNGERTPIHQSGYFPFGTFGKKARFEFRPAKKGEYKVIVDKDYFSWFWLFDYESGGQTFKKIK